MILGCGIAGLYSAYTLLRENPDRKLILIEKEDRLGGRVHTYKDKFMNVEAGAGRFSDSHTFFMQLLKELHLESNMVPISSESKFTEDSPYYLSVVIGKVIVASKMDFYNDLTSMTFLDYAKLFLSEDEIEFIQQAYGYYSEFVIMNAKDAIQLMFHLNQKFYILDGGLQQVIDALEKQLRMFPNVSIHTHETVTSITRQCNTYTVRTDQNTYMADFCICTLPKQILEKLDISKPFRSSLQKIKCSPLCRIYCTFKTPWWTSTKYTTPNPIRMIIPYSKNTIMISYSDHKFALFWNDLYQKGEEHVLRALTFYIKESLGIDMPRPLKTKVFFWGCGVGYWGVGANSVSLAKQLREPYPRFYICGEHYSSAYQQWMEGALETSHAVCDLILQKKLYRRKCTRRGRLHRRYQRTYTR